ncbi:copia protein [Caerostris darwini]|uniref:Copia protein n=1 Tax=Caerostris darwini TaxID=1538125 RepID=A0AAV4PIP3_9ARAC|nr:copia protein [Caerostris darwini]
MLLMDAAHPLEDMYPAFQSIRPLPPDFQDIVQILYKWSDKNFKLHKIEMELIAEENRIRQLKTDMNSVDAFIVNHKIKKVSDNSRVYDCKNKLKFTKSKFKNEIGPCYMCKKMGHLKRNCKYLNSNSLKLNTFNVKDNNEYVFNDRNKHESLVTEININELTDKFNWIIYTAATQHFCNNANLFTDLQSTVGKSMSLAVGGSESAIEGIGTVKFYVNVNGTKNCIILENVMYSLN